MLQENFNQKVKELIEKHDRFVTKKNEPLDDYNGIFKRYKNPVLTGKHAPFHWRFDLDYSTNPNLQERLGVNAAFNAGAMEHNGNILLVSRTEGYDRKSFFAIAESPNGIDNFKFWDYPLTIPETDEPDTNTYDMRFVKHEDGWIYGLFCAERKDKNAPASDTSAADAQCGIARTKDLKNWDRLPDLKTKSPQQRNVVLHPEFIDGKYAFYTRPQDGFISTGTGGGTGGGIGWGFSDSMENPVIEDEKIIDERVYHTIKEVKNGIGPAPIKTQKGWLQLAHGVRGTAAGLRYVLYLFLTDLKDPSKVIASPGGFFIAPSVDEWVGDVPNVAFSNGWVAKENGEVFIYYASADSRMYVATSTIDLLLDYVINTPSDALRSYASVQQRNELIAKNLKLMDKYK
ncbi:MAG: glycosidase [Melioribacteraceae bacterium]|nr:glycosidase [Melioribacteraceae bacterium]MCF8265165.1 glycosidase [Melioribacteraceae bacterium]MCF8413235.1 glycosidase [Melioribacteraceae bacterium]